MYAAKLLFQMVVVCIDCIILHQVASHPPALHDSVLQDIAVPLRTGEAW